MISLTDIKLIYLREMRMAARERHIIFNVVLMPVFMYPIFIWLMYTGLTFVVGQTEDFTSRIVLIEHGKSATEFRQRLIDHNRIEIASGENPTTAVKAGDIDLIIEVSDDPVRLHRFVLTFDSSKDRSRLARDRIETLIDNYRSDYLEQTALALGIDRAAYQKFWIVRKNVATERDMGRFILGLMAPMLLIIMVSIGGLYPALEATAGERERSTWETMLTTATDRVNIVVAKYAYVVSLATLAGLLNFLAITISMRTILGPLMGERAEGMSFTIPITAFFLIIIVTFFLAMFVGALMMIVATFARTFKEAQSMVSPIMMIMVLPGVFLQIPGIEFSMQLALVPIVNICLLLRECIAGVYHWPQIGLTVLTEFIGIGIMLWLATALLKFEDVVVGGYDGNLIQFIKKRMLSR